jgi:hypothetical protein
MALEIPSISKVFKAFQSKVSSLGLRSAPFTCRAEVRLRGKPLALSLPNSQQLPLAVPESGPVGTYQELWGAKPPFPGLTSAKLVIHFLKVSKTFFFARTSVSSVASCKIRPELDSGRVKVTAIPDRDSTAPLFSITVAILYFAWLWHDRGDPLYA